MPTTTNILTLNQLIENLRVIATNHRQINRFQYGEAWEFYQSGTTVTPEMWVQLDGVERPDASSTIYKVHVWIVDNVKRGEIDELEVQSDLVQIAEDIIAQVRNGDYGWVFGRNEVISMNIRTEYTPKNLASVDFVLPIKIKKVDNRCAIPFTSNPTDGAYSNTGIVSIYDIQTNNVITTLNVGASYGVYQFGIIDGGSSNTIYSDTIVANP